MKKKNGFTLVELLAVIVILAIILVIAVPQIMETINNATEGAFQSSAKLIAASAEREYLVRKTLGETHDEITTGTNALACDDVATTTSDYSSCEITFDNTGKVTKVELAGAGKFANMWICDATREAATVSTSACA